MFAALELEFARRSTEINDVWRTIDRLEREEILTHILQPGLRTLKGLLFVHLYAAYESAVVNSFSAVLRYLNTHTVSLERTRRSVLALAFQSAFQTLQDLSERRTLPTRIKLFEDADSSAPAFIPDALFPLDDSHFRSAQLSTICRIIGLPLTALVPDPRLYGWITEVVDHRNAIAHGRDTPQSIGARYSSPALGTRIQQLDFLCSHIFMTLDQHARLRTNFEK